MSIFYTHNEKNSVIFAPSCGNVLPIDDVPDAVFSSGALGEGFALIPEVGEVLSPCSGKITFVSDLLNNYYIKSDDGYELLIRIGIGSEKMLGDGIRPYVEKGQQVVIGTPLCGFDKALFHQNNVPPLVSVILLNSDEYSSITVFEGSCHAAKTEVMTFLSSPNKLT
ncbi:MAG: PTS glucose transporter subunit IIA [Clostridia bacterium]|nr:PTS glucose transporter subunit IIA [Clostridia bacterium]